MAHNHKAANEAFQLWDIIAKPKQGPIFYLKRKAEARCKYAMMFKKNMKMSWGVKLLPKRWLIMLMIHFGGKSKLSTRVRLPTNINGKSEYVETTLS